MPYANDQEHMAALGKRLEIARNIAAELVWIDEKPDWWAVDVPFLRRKLQAAQQQVAALQDSFTELFEDAKRGAISYQQLQARCGRLEKALEGCVASLEYVESYGAGSHGPEGPVRAKRIAQARAVLQKAPDAGEPVTVQVAKPLGHILQLRLTGEDMRRLEQLAALAGKKPNIIRFAEILLSEALAPPEAP